MEPHVSLRILVENLHHYGIRFVALAPGRIFRSLILTGFKQSKPIRNLF